MAVQRVDCLVAAEMGCRTRTIALCGWLVVWAEGRAMASGAPLRVVVFCARSLDACACSNNTSVAVLRKDYDDGKAKHVLMSAQ